MKQIKNVQEHIIPRHKLFLTYYGIIKVKT